MNVICFLKGFMTLITAYLFFNLDFVFKVFSWTWTWSRVNYADFNPKYDVLFSVIIYLWVRAVLVNVQSVSKAVGSMKKQRGQSGCQI